MKSNPLTPFFEFAIETAYLAGRLTLAYFHQKIIPEYKSDLSPVTQADRQVETFIRQRIEEAYPTHTIVGEEFAPCEGASAYRWFIDPIDGTKSFMRGVPLYAVLLGFEIEGEVRVGVAYFPALDEMLAAAEGLGCWWNGRRARVSSISRLEEAYLTTTSCQAIHKHQRQAAWERLLSTCAFQGGWGDAYGYLLVATGRVEIMLDPAMKVWDGAPFPPILREAGGYFGDWHGNPGVHSEALATNYALLPQVLALLNDTEETERATAFHP